MKSCQPQLLVTNLEATLAFYNRVLGFETVFSLPGDDGAIFFAGLQRGDVHLMIGIDPEKSNQSTTSTNTLGFGVRFYLNVGDDEDIDALYAVAVQQGATVLHAPTDQFWGDRDWGITDPDGYELVVGKTVREVDLSQLTVADMVGAPA